MKILFILFLLITTIYTETICIPPFDTLEQFAIFGGQTVNAGIGTVNIYNGSNVGGLGVSDGTFTYYGGSLQISTPLAITAYSQFMNVYNYFNSLNCDTTNPSFGSSITFYPGVTCFTASVFFTDVTLNFDDGGNPNAVFVIIGSQSIVISSSVGTYSYNFTSGIVNNNIVVLSQRNNLGSSIFIGSGTGVLTVYGMYLTLGVIQLENVNIYGYTYANNTEAETSFEHPTSYFNINTSFCSIDNGLCCNQTLVTPLNTTLELCNSFSGQFIYSSSITTQNVTSCGTACCSNGNCISNILPSTCLGMNGIPSPFFMDCLNNNITCISASISSCVINGTCINTNITTCNSLLGTFNSNLNCSQINSNNDSSLCPITFTSNLTNVVIGAYSTITNVPSIGTIVIGDVVLTPGSSITGFGIGQGIIIGSLNINNQYAIYAMQTALNFYNQFFSLPCSTDLTGINLNGLVLYPGVYCFDSSAFLTGILPLTLIGYSPNSTFTFQIGSTLTTSSGSSILLVNTNICNVNWVIGSSVTLGSGSSFSGNIFADSSITLNTGSIQEGKMFALNGAITLDTNQIFNCNDFTCLGMNATIIPNITCCNPDFSCSQTTTELCLSNGGIVNLNTSCSQVNCQAQINATYTFACCNNGNCQMLNQSQCLINEGSFNYGLNCTMSLCLIKYQCCQQDGTCSLQNYIDCANINGTTDYNRTDCNLACPQPPIEPNITCCNPDGSCSNTTLSLCLSNNGTSNNSTSCSQAQCQAPLNPSACCYNDIRQCIMTNNTYCLQTGGKFNLNATCDICNGPCCSLPEPLKKLGKCKKGNCIDNVQFSNCGLGYWGGSQNECINTICPGPVFNITSCVTQLPDSITCKATFYYTYSGNVTAYLPQGETFNSINVVESFRDDSKIFVPTVFPPGVKGRFGFYFNCLRSAFWGIVYQGNVYETIVNLNSTQCPWACCIPYNGTCIENQPSTCLSIGGIPNPANICIQTRCPAPQYACCKDGNCNMMTQISCVLSRGIYNEGKNCSQVMCQPLPITSRCCKDGICTIKTRSDCLNYGGIPGADNTTCLNYQCPLPIYPCCFFDGNCLDLTEQQCIDERGTVNRINSTCSQTQCKIPEEESACCHEDEKCSMETERRCIDRGGKPNRGVKCTQLLCLKPIHPCCLRDGNCRELREHVCIGEGGTFHRNITRCSEARCSIPETRAACCGDDYYCRVDTERNCLREGGIFHRDHPNCNNIKCDPREEKFACCHNTGDCIDRPRTQCLAYQGVPHTGLKCSEIRCQIATCCDRRECYKTLRQLCLNAGHVWIGSDSCERHTCMNNYFKFN